MCILREERGKSGTEGEDEEGCGCAMRQIMVASYHKRVLERKRLSLKAGFEPGPLWAGVYGLGRELMNCWALTFGSNIDGLLNLSSELVREGRKFQQKRKEKGLNVNFFHFCLKSTCIKMSRNILEII